MPSPFPGMDPYLESDMWSSFHANFASAIARALAPRLRPNYIAVTDKYYVRIALRHHPDLKGMIPDVAVVSRRSRRPIGVGAAVAAPKAPIVATTALPVPMPVYRVLIRDRIKRSLVTAIEILSPANKVGSGYEKYLRKRWKLLRSPAHLLEIDLLRQGRRLPVDQPLPSASYYVFLHRADHRPETEIWPIQLADPLPEVQVPLRSGDRDLTLDLQAVFTQLYDDYSLDLALEDRGQLDIPVSAEEKAWIKRCLKKAARPL